MAGALSVERNRLELGLGDERRSFEIFGAGVRGAAPPAAAIRRRQPPPEPPATDDAAIAGVDPQGDADDGDDAPGQE